MEITDKQIVNTATINAPVKDVWHNWTTSEGVTAFLGVPANVKLERGGPFELYFDANGAPGLRGSEGCTIISFVPYEMLSITWNAPPTIPYVRNHEYKTWVTLFFSETVTGTDVRLVHTGWPEGVEWDKTFSYFDNAWGYVLKALVAYWKKN
jgi:uncharacterized protein YndB with AHSA1/START domain